MFSLGRAYERGELFQTRAEPMLGAGCSLVEMAFQEHTCFPQKNKKSLVKTNTKDHFKS
jgi:hypothetical protein